LTLIPLISSNSEEIALKPTSLILVKAREKHGVKTLPDSDLVMIFFKAPESTKSASWQEVQNRPKMQNKLCLEVKGGMSCA
jgi:hypothetical protein